jgi:hypothetical protein
MRQSCKIEGIGMAQQLEPRDKGITNAEDEVLSIDNQSEFALQPSGPLDQRASELRFRL